MVLLFLQLHLPSGSTGSSSFCAPFDCYTVTRDGGSLARGEVSWDVVDSTGVVILSGGAPYSGTLCLPVILGCTDPNADNYDSTATIDNGFCLYGCMKMIHRKF